MELNHPFDEVVESADKIIKAGAKVYFKFTCVNCGSRQTFDTPNVVYVEGTCEECGAITNLKETGTNFLVVMEG